MALFNSGMAFFIYSNILFKVLSLQLINLEIFLEVRGLPLVNFLEACIIIAAATV